jgi:hypothetical protein
VVPALLRRVKVTRTPEKGEGVVDADGDTLILTFSLEGEGTLAAQWISAWRGNEVMTTALLDRLLHRCHVFNIKGRSYRPRDLGRALKQ